MERMFKVTHQTAAAGSDVHTSLLAISLSFKKNKCIFIFHSGFFLLDYYVFATASVCVLGLHVVCVAIWFCKLFSQPICIEDYAD